jgi:hypothetical protein
VKKVVIAIVVLVIILMGGGIYWKSQQPQAVSSDPIDAIPLSATLVVSYPNLTKAWDAFEAQDYYELLIPIKELESFFARNMMLDSIMRYDQDMKKALSGATLWSSYHSLSGDSLSFFHALKPSVGGTGRVVDAFKKAMGSKGSVTEQKIGERTVIKVVFSNPFYVVYFTSESELILASSNLNLLEESIAQLKSGETLRKDENFEKALDAAGKNVEANIFINFEKMPAYLSGAFKSGIKGLQSSIGNFASWMELDLNLKPNGLTFNGFTYTNDSLPQYLQLFLDQKPQPISFPEVLPSNTASFLFFGIDNAISFSSDYRKMLEQFGNLGNLDAQLDSLNNLYDIDLEQNLLAWVGNSFGLCITEPRHESFADNSYLIFETKSSDLAAKLLDDLAVKLAEKSGQIPETRPENGILIKQLPLNGIVGKLLGVEFEDFNTPSYAIINNHVVFGTNTESVVSFLQHVQADRTLAKELSFSRFAENLGSTFNVFSYHHLKQSKNILSSYLNRDAIQVLTSNPELMQSFEALGTQISSTGQSFYSNVFLKYDPKWEDENESYWEAEMDAKAQINPVFVSNHLSGEPEIFVQDQSNAIYLFNQLGKRLFKAEIAEPIESRPIQVDAFKNGKLQYIFNSKNFIYLVDRDGNNVDGFPIELVSPAETNLAVFDYDNNSDYRLLITCENKRIYNYTINGKKVNGWKHNRASDPTIHPFKYLMVSGKDYLITGESSGKIHLLDRAGKNRVKVEKYVESSAKNHLQVFKSSETAFTGVYITDKQGKIHRISLDGDVKSMDLGKFSPNHYFKVEDLNTDGGPEFIFSDLNVLQVFNYKKEKVFEQRIAPSATEPFIIDYGEGKKGIGYCFRDTEQLMLFDARGEMAKGFPLSGNSEFDVLVTDSETLVVSSGGEASVVIQSIR